MTEILGKGSYGLVSKATCKRTGKIVAIKLMDNQTNTEYDSIKLLREIQLMKQLNNIGKTISDKQKSPFVTELIEIIFPGSDDPEI